MTMRSDGLVFQVGDIVSRMGPDRFRVTEVSSTLVRGVCIHTQDSAAEVWTVGDSDWFVDDDLELIERAPRGETDAPSPR